MVTIAQPIVELKRRQLVDAVAAFNTQDELYNNLHRNIPELRTTLQSAEAALLARTNEKTPRDEAVTAKTRAHSEAEALVQPAVDKEAEEKTKSEAAEEKLRDLRIEIGRANSELGDATRDLEALGLDISTAEGLLTQARRRLEEVRTAKAASEARLREAEAKAALSAAAAAAPAPDGKIARLRAAAAARIKGTPAQIAAADALAVEHAKGANAINQATLEGIEEKVTRDDEALNDGTTGLKSKLPAAEQLVREKTTAHNDLKGQEAGLMQAATEAATAYQEAQADTGRKKADAEAKLRQKEEAVRQQTVAAQAITDATEKRDTARQNLDEEEAKVEPAKLERARLKDAAEKAKAAVELAINEEAERKAVAELGNIVSLAIGADNMGKGDSFNDQQIIGIVRILNDQLKRSGAWGDTVHHTISHDKDKIVFDDRIKPNKPGTVTRMIIVNPRTIDIKGDMDDKTIQAALIAANAMWGEQGIQIKTIDPWLKSRLLANADHLHKLGLIKKYKTKTLFGTVGEGFANAKGLVTAPRDTWRFGTKGITYRHRLDCLEHGLESNTLRPVKWYKLGGMKNGISAAAPAPGRTA